MPKIHIKPHFNTNNVHDVKNMPLTFCFSSKISRPPSATCDWEGQSPQYRDELVEWREQISNWPPWTLDPLLCGTDGPQNTHIQLHIHVSVPISFWFITSIITIFKLSFQQHSPVLVFYHRGYSTRHVVEGLKSSTHYSFRLMVTRPSGEFSFSPVVSVFTKRERFYL